MATSGQSKAERIGVDPNVRFGKAVIRGTRITVDEVVGLAAAGRTAVEVAREYEIEVEDVNAALAYAADAVARERRWAQ